MNFSYNWLKEYIPNLPSPEKLAEILTLKSFETGKIEKQKNDFLLEIDILPNRAPDCWSYLGLSREIGSLLSKKIKEPKIKFSEADENIKNSFDLDIEAKKNLNVYYLKIIKNVKVSASPVWLKKKLGLYGINSINNIIDSANLAMLEIGQPVHIFDYDKISGKKIIVREAKEGEKFVSLENKTYSLPKGALVIADKKDILALAGIKGGKKAKVNNKTKNIIIESASFPSPLILKTSKEINLITDASRRFGAGLSPYFAKLGLEFCVSKIKKIAGGKISRNALEFENLAKKLPIFLPFSKIENILGKKINEKEILKILKSVYCDLKMPAVFPPTWREDLKIKEDLIEEIARIYGLKKIESRRIISEIKLGKSEEKNAIKEQIKETVARAGFNEVYLYSFIGEKDLKLLGEETARKTIEIGNFFRPEFRYLRPSLSVSLLKGLSEAKKYSSPALLFELAPVFSKTEKSKDTPEFQKDRLILGIAAEKSEVFFEFKGKLTSIFESLGFFEVEYSDLLNIDCELIKDLGGIFHPFRSALIKSKNKIIGIIGEPREEVKKYFELKGGVALAEIELAKLLPELATEKNYRPISKYPALYRDIALLVPKKTKIIEIQSLIKSAGSKLLISADLFDVYEDEEAFAARKNMAFHLIFQSEEKTLSDKEADKIMEKIIKRLEENPDFKTRR